MRRKLSGLLVLSLVGACATASPAAAGTVRAGAATIDAGWHIGASAGQYASTRTECNTPGDPPASQGDLDNGFSDCFGEFDPSAQSVKNKPSYGQQSRMEIRAIVFQSDSDKLVAVAKTDMYIPQDLVWRRAAQLLDAETGGAIGLTNFTMGITHDHSAPYYSSTAFGAWSFQDVFDIRFYNYLARKMADAVEAARANMVDAEVGAGVTYLDRSQQNVPGPQHADEGTPAGYPKSYSDHAVSVVRFDRLDHKPIGQIVSYALHGEGLDGNDLISADWVGPFQRRLDRLTGGVTVYLQGAVGNSETEENTNHDIHQRLFFEHKQFAQADRNGGLVADAAFRAWKDIGTDTPDGDAEYGNHHVPMSSSYGVGEMDRWFPGPVSHPFPTVGNCRTNQTASADGTVGIPAAGLPDCEQANVLAPCKLGDPAGVKSPLPNDFEPICTGPETGYTLFASSPLDPGLSYDKLTGAGIPVPANYGAPSHGALEESLGIHLQAVKIGPILLTMCSCEQWHDQALNIRTRTDKTPGNEWLGFDWANPNIDPNHPLSSAATQQGDESACTKNGDGTYAANGSGTGHWTCPDPNSIPERVDNAHPAGKITNISDHDFRVMEAQILNDARGWDDPTCAMQGCGLEAESFSPDPTKIFGGYTHDDVVVAGHASPTGAAQAVQSADYARDRGYTLTIPIGMANDYNGYIATLREYMRGDHYRKALTGYGPHSSDYLATRLTEMGHALNGDAAAQKKVDIETDPTKYPVDSLPYAALIAKDTEDQAHNDVEAQALGNSGNAAATAYEASLPDDGGSPGTAKEQPTSIRRFDTAFFVWDGGDNYVDNPTVTVQRKGTDGQFHDYADQSGQVPMIVKYPGVSNGPVYASGGQEWKWSASFESLVSEYPEVDPGNSDGGLEDSAGRRATEPGTYRFHVVGHTRSGHATTGYSVDSRSFDVGAWGGLQPNDIRIAPDGAAIARVGPVASRDILADNGTKIGAQAAVGPINYPETSDVTATAHGFRYIRPNWTTLHDPGSSTSPDPRRLEFYCLECAFRPWLDFSKATKVTFTFADDGAPSSGATARAASVDRVPGHFVEDTINCPQQPGGGSSVCQYAVSDRELPPGKVAYVCPGDLQDAWGNYNFDGSAMAPGGNVANASCAPLETKVDGPIVDPPPQASGGAGSGQTAETTLKGAGSTATVPPASLGLKASSAPKAPKKAAKGRTCASRRIIKFHVVAPVHRVKVRSATVKVNGKVLKHVKGDNRLVTLRNFGKPKSTVTITLKVLGSDGRHYTATRRFHLCVVKRVSHYKRKPAPKKAKAKAKPKNPRHG